MLAGFRVLVLEPGAVAQVENANPNSAAIRAYGRIEWHGENATIFAGGSRPLNVPGLTLSTCLGIPVNSEDPLYRYLGDLLDVTDPQWAAQHPGYHVYAGRPGKVEITFSTLPEGTPGNTAKLLQDIAQQVTGRNRMIVVAGNGGSGARTVPFRADRISDRRVLDELITLNGEDDSYSLRCEPLDKRFRFIDVGLVTRRLQPGGECAASGYDPR